MNRVNLRQLKLWLQEKLFWVPFGTFRPLLYTVGALAFIWRRLLFRTTFIAISGSLGKTTAKECLAAILGAHASTMKSSGNRNSGIGVCVSVLRVRPWHRYAVLELSGAAPGNLLMGASLVRPDVAVILNVLRTHTTVFSTLAAHAAEKTRLLEQLRPGGLAVLNCDDPLVSVMADRPGINVRRFGTSPSFDFWADQVSARWPARLTFQAHCSDYSETVMTQFIGAHWLPSVLAAIAAADACGVRLRAGTASLRSVEPFPGRLQAVQLPIGAIALRDDYNASIDTLEAACRVLAEADAGRRLFVVNDFSDSGKNRKHRLRYLAEAAARIAEVALFIGENAEYGCRRAIEAGIEKNNVHHFPNLQAAAEFLRMELKADDLLLLKGRTTDHAGRVVLAQFHHIGCWKDYCRKTTMCDNCWELRPSSSRD